MKTANQSTAQLPLQLLNDAAHLLESLDEPEVRARRVLQILQRIVPYDGCVLVEAKNGDCEFVVLPDLPEEDISVLRQSMLDCLRMISDELPANLSDRPTQIAASVPWNSYLGLPLVGNDRVIGLLLIGSNATDAYGEDDLSLLAVVAGQLAAFLTSVRLHETEMAQAEQLDRTRNEFLGEVSHELKTPLTAIKGSTSMALSSSGPSPAEARELFEVIDEQAERLRELIGNLLDMTRIEAGSLPVTPQPASLPQIIEAEVARFSRAARDRPVDVSLPPSLPPVIADPRRISQVMANLLSNASKASPPGLPIDVSAEQRANDVLVRVHDQGRGISLEKLPLLFRKFAQVHESGGRGTGLGLAISKGIVEAHGGRIWAESAGQGEGSTFSFTLPLAQEEPNA